MVAQKVGYFMETEEKKIYTIEDIARELGVSKTTVSRAISGKGETFPKPRHGSKELGNIVMKI